MQLIGLLREARAHEEKAEGTGRAGTGGGGRSESVISIRTCLSVRLGSRNRYAFGQQQILHWLCQLRRGFGCF